MAHRAREEFRRLGLPEWCTWVRGPTRTEAFPYHVIGDYNGHPVVVRFGAFLGWPDEMLWWQRLANRLSLCTLAHLELLHIKHQGGGHGCVGWSGVVRPVAVSADYLRFAEELCRDYFYALDGHLWRSPSEVEPEIAAYRSRLHDVGLTTDCLADPRGRLYEAIYPLDPSEENLRAFLADWQGVHQSLLPLLSDASARQHLKLYILADNSD